MTIETRSASKRRVLEALKQARMGWCEYIIHKFDFAVGAFAKFIYTNLLLILVLITATMLVFHIDANTDYFEIAAAFIQQRPPVLRADLMQLSVYDYLNLHLE